MTRKVETTVLMKAPIGRVRGLDAIRFVCAFWVVMYHNTGIGQVHQHVSGTLLWRAAQVVWSLSFNGTAAVMVFFVISGFAIHYPFRHGESPAWGEYFLRRYIRIGVPVGVSVALLSLIGPYPRQLQSGVLWSLYAEAIYYTLYPLMMIARRKWGWRLLLAACTGAYLLLLLHHPTLSDFHGDGVTVTWILGLPIWLLGCLLAERSDALTAARVPRIWVWRIGVVAAANFCNLLRFHSPVGAPWTMPLFSVLIFFWLQQEIRQNRAKAPIAYLEKAGAWSYSLYLVHIPAFWLLYIWHVSFHPAPLLAALQVSFALGVAYVYYLLVERPSHWLARQVKQKGARKADPPELERGQMEQPQGTGE